MIELQKINWLSLDDLRFNVLLLIITSIGLTLFGDWALIRGIENSIPEFIGVGLGCIIGALMLLVAIFLLVRREMIAHEQRKVKNE